jgi:protein-L-isoaspartate(D-aspartate) O-methyltransferase
MLLVAGVAGGLLVGCRGTMGSSTTAALSAPAVDPYVDARHAMVRYQIANRGVEDTRVLAAMEHVPRHEFVLPTDVGQAYADHPLPIGYGQTISQPYIVALMTELLELEPEDKVLEIGTGSGYQAAVLAELTDEVYTVEIIPELAASAAERLKRLGYTDVRTKTADGYYGWEEFAPFDAIVVTAAPDHVPSPLVQQLKEGGRLVIPVGPPGGYQTLWRITKSEGQVVSENITGVLFVPLIRGTQ